MTAIERTAYPRFKRNLTAKDLEEVYIPTPQERFLALRSTKGTVAESNSSGLLTTFGGSQEVFAVDYAAAGYIVHSKNRSESPEAARNQAV